MKVRALRRRQRRRQASTLVRRAAAGFFAAQLLTVTGLLVFDSQRRKDRPDREFPHEADGPVPVSGGDMRVYTFGEDLFADMLADIEAAQERIYFETLSLIHI